MSKPPKMYLWGYVAALAMVIGFCGASVNSRISVKEFRKIPQSKRLMLERNLDVYLKLSDSDKSRYWEMHRHVEEHKLTPLMEDYNKWLGSLSPFERQLLRTTSEAAAKVAEVEKILKSQHKIKEHRLPELIARIIGQKNRDPRNTSYRSLHHLISTRPEFDFKDQYVFSEPQLESLFDILLSQLNASRQTKLLDDNSEGIERMFKILRESLTQTVNPQVSWPSFATYTALKEEGVSLDFDDSLEERSFNGRVVPKDLMEENRRRIAFRRTLIRSLMVYEMQQFDKKHRPSEKELLDFFKLYDTSKQHALLASPADYQAEALKWLYIWETYHHESIFSKPEVRNNVLQLMSSHFRESMRDKFNGRRPGGDRHRPGEKSGDGPPHKKRRPNGERPDRPKID